MDNKWLISLGFGCITLVSGSVGSATYFAARLDVALERIESLNQKLESREEVIRSLIQKNAEDIEDNSERLDSIGVRKASFTPTTQKLTYVDSGWDVYGF